MSDISTNYTTRIIVDKTPAEAFDAIVDPRSWWGKDIEGSAAVLGEDWSYRYKDIHFSRHRTVELVPGQKVVWHVFEANLNFVADRSEWKDTDLIFDIAERDGKTEVRFTHRGLVPAVECYDTCSSVWTGLIGGSLHNLIQTGEGNPDNFE